MADSIQPNNAPALSGFLREPKPGVLLSFIGRRVASEIADDGLLPSTLRDPDYLLIEAQRTAYYAVVAGLLLAEDSLVDSGLRAFERAFDFAGTDGSFPNERGGINSKANAIHPKSEFIEHAARTVLLLGQVGAECERVSHLLPRVHQSACWLAQTPDVDKFFGRCVNMNQLMFIPSALQEAGAAAGDVDLTSRAEHLMRQALSRQMDDGTLPEKGGFDSTYQLVSAELLAHCAVLLPASPWRDTVMAALHRAVDRFVRVVDPRSGRIDHSGNTRTQPMGPAIAGAFPKDTLVDKIPIRLYFLGYVLGRRDELYPLADSIQFAGQPYGKDKKEKGSRAGSAEMRPLRYAVPARPTS